MSHPASFRDKLTPTEMSRYHAAGLVSERDKLLIPLYLKKNYKSRLTESFNNLIYSFNRKSNSIILHT